MVACSAFFMGNLLKDDLTADPFPDRSARHVPDAMRVSARKFSRLQTKERGDLAPSRVSWKKNGRNLSKYDRLCPSEGV